MTTDKVTRRTFLNITATVAGALCCPSVLAAERPLHFIWWGTKERAALTNRAIAAFEAAHPGVSIDTTYLEWLDYWQRFVSLVAIRQTPDLIQMDYRYLKLYADNGILLPLDSYLGNRLNIESFGQQNIDSCRVNGKLYGVNLGINSTAAIVDSQSWAAVGVAPPTFGTSWDAFSAKCEAFAGANKRANYYATPDASGNIFVFENWLRQRGKGLYGPDGQLAFNATDAAEWFEYWARIRGVGGCVPADIQMLDKHSIETSVLVLGYAAMDFAHSNMLVNYQERMQHKLDLSAFPVTDGGQPGHYYKPSQMLSIAARSQSPEMAVALANFLVMSPQAVEILGVDRGVPASEVMRERLLPHLDAVSQKTVNYISRLKPFVGPLPPTPPESAGEIAITLQSVGHEIAFKQMTPKQGGEKLIRDANALLTR